MEAQETQLFQVLAATCSETTQAFAQFTGMPQNRRQLLTLIEEQGEISHAALQQRLGMDGAVVTRLVKQFEAQGLLTRRLDPQDNRFTLMTLTASGQAVVKSLAEAHRQFQTRLLAGVSDLDREHLVQALEQIRANVRTFKAEEHTGD